MTFDPTSVEVTCVTLPKDIVSKSHENTLKYVDTVNLFAKTWIKGHWPLDDLWPHICWGHRCDSNQGSLRPSPMGIHQCMWIQWSILQKLPHTYTYYVQNQWSRSLFLNNVQARQKGKATDVFPVLHFFSKCVVFLNLRCINKICQYSPILAICDAAYQKKKKGGNGGFAAKMAFHTNT